MAKKYYIALQTPTVELPIQSDKDAEGKTAQIIGVFKRYGSKESDVRLKELETLANQELSIELLDKGTEAIKAFFVEKETAIKAATKADIIALKGFPLQEVDDITGEVTQIIIEDSRTVLDNPELWGEAGNCLDFLLDILLVR